LPPGKCPGSMGLFGGSSKKAAEQEAADEAARKAKEEKEAEKKAAELKAQKEAEARDKERKRAAALAQAERIKKKVADKKERAEAKAEGASGASSNSFTKAPESRKTLGDQYKSKVNRAGGMDADEMAKIREAMAKKNAAIEAKKKAEEEAKKKARKDAGEEEEAQGAGATRWNLARMKLAAAAPQAGEEAPVKKEATLAQKGAARGAAAAAGGVFYTGEENRDMLKKLSNLNNRVRELEKRNRMLEQQLEDYADGRSGIGRAARRMSNAAASAADAVAAVGKSRRRSVTQGIAAAVGLAKPADAGEEGAGAAPRKRRMSIGQRLGLVASAPKAPDDADADASAAAPDPSSTEPVIV
jgi:colicin import membrane protein